MPVNTLLQGVPFGQLQQYFPDGTVVGTINNTTQAMRCPPTPDAPVGQDDYILLMRSATRYARHGYFPTAVPRHVDLGRLGRRCMMQRCEHGAGDWDPLDYGQWANEYSWVRVDCILNCVLHRPCVPFVWYQTPPQNISVSRTMGSSSVQSSDAGGQLEDGTSAAETSSSTVSGLPPAVMGSEDGEGAADGETLYQLPREYVSSVDEQRVR